MRAPLASLCFVAVALAAPRVRAQALGSTLRPIAAQLDYQLRDGAEGRCPDAAFLRREIAGDLGFDAFAPDAAGMPVGRVHVTITRTPRGFAGQVDYEAGVRPARRSYSVNGSQSATCELLVAKFVAIDLSTELTILALPPVEEPAAPPPAAPAPPPPAPAAPPPQAPTAPAPARPAPSPSSSLHPRLEVGLAGFGSFGTGPHPTLGGALHLGVAITPFGHDRVRLLFAAEARVDALATYASGAQTQLFAGSLVACGSKDLVPGPAVTLGFLGCVVGTAGVLRGSWPTFTGFLSYRPGYAAVGARFGFEVKFTSLVLVLPQLEILPTVVQPLVFPQFPGVSVGVVTGTAGVAAAFPF